MPRVFVIGVSWVLQRLELTGRGSVLSVPMGKKNRLVVVCWKITGAGAIAGKTGQPFLFICAL